MESSRNDLVVKSNKLVEASYRLSLVEQQLILFAICKARENKTLITPSTVLTITALEFAEQFGANITTVYNQLKSAADVLFDRRVLIDDTDEKTGLPRKVKTRWVQDVAYIDGTGQIQMAFARKMIPYITRLDESFTRYRLEKIGHLTSAHAVHLYELLLQRLNMTPPRPIEIEWLKERMDLSDEYQRTDSFKRSVLDVAIKQINKFTDLKVSYTQIKTGRVITHFDFSIKLKSSDTRKSKPEKVPAKAARTRPVQLELPECVTEKVVQHPDDPAVQAERLNALKAARIRKPS